MFAKIVRGDRGSGSILAVAVLAGVLAVFSLLAPLAVVLVAKQGAVTAADNAAIAAADVLSGALPGVPCAVAGTVASANGASVSGCIVTGASVTVTVTARVVPSGPFAGAVAVTGRATAGPPP